MDKNEENVHRIFSVPGIRTEILLLFCTKFQCDLFGCIFNTSIYLLVYFISPLSYFIFLNALKYEKKYSKNGRKTLVVIQRPKSRKALGANKTRFIFLFIVGTCYQMPVADNENYLTSIK